MNWDRQNIHQTIFYFASILIVITLPFNELKGAKFNSMAVILLVANWLFEGNLKLKLRLFFENKIALLFSLGFLVNVLGLLYTDNMEEGFREVTVKLSMLIMPLVFSTSAPLASKSFSRILLGFCSATILVTFYLFKDGFEYTFGNMYNPHYITILHREILGRVYCSVYLSVVSFILILYFIRRDKIFSAGNVLAVLCLSYILYVHGILIVKMTVIAFLLTCLLLVFIYLNDIRKRKLMFILFFLLIGGLLITYNTNSRFREIANKALRLQPIEVTEPGITFDITSFSIRNNIWTASLAILNSSSNWVTGVGTGDVPNSLIQKYEELNIPPNTYHDPHNEYISSLLRNGMLGLLILLASLFVPLYISIKRRNYLYTAFLLMSMICLLSESWFSRHSGVVFFAFFNSLFAFQMVGRKTD